MDALGFGLVLALLFTVTTILALIRFRDSWSANAGSFLNFGAVFGAVAVVTILIFYGCIVLLRFFYKEMTEQRAKIYRAILTIFIVTIGLTAIAAILLIAWAPSNDDNWERALNVTIALLVIGAIFSLLFLPLLINKPYKDSENKLLVKVGLRITFPSEERATIEFLSAPEERVGGKVFTYPKTNEQDLSRPYSIANLLPWLLFMTKDAGRWLTVRKCEFGEMGRLDYCAIGVTHRFLSSWKEICLIVIFAIPTVMWFASSAFRIPALVAHPLFWLMLGPLSSIWLVVSILSFVFWRGVRRRLMIEIDSRDHTIRITRRRSTRRFETVKIYFGDDSDLNVLCRELNNLGKNTGADLKLSFDPY